MSKLEHRWGRGPLTLHRKRSVGPVTLGLARRPGLQSARRESRHGMRIRGVELRLRAFIGTELSYQT